jgi:ankyrin repeat protein
MPSLSNNTNLFGTDETNIWISAGEGNIDLVARFLESQSVNSQDETGYSSLHAAVSYDCREMIEFLLSKGANVNLKDEDGESALFVAETVETAKLLMDNGADPMIRNNEGFLAIEIFAAEGIDELVEYVKQFTPEFRMPDVPSDRELQNLVLESIQNYVVSNGEQEME